MTREEEIGRLVTALQDLVGILTRAEPADKAEIYAQQASG
jgi:hypothetical protein